MNIVDISYGNRRTVLTKTLVTQLEDICGDMWRVKTRAYSSHIQGKLVTVGQGLRDSICEASYSLSSLRKQINKQKHMLLHDRRTDSIFKY